MQAQAQSIFKVLLQGHLEEDLTCSDRHQIPSHKDLFQDLEKIYLEGIVKDFGQDLHARTPLRESHKVVRKGPVDTRTTQEPPTRAFIQAPLIHGV